MLSVQSPGYAGMERLGTPGGPGGGGRADRYRDLNDLSHLQNMTTSEYNIVIHGIRAARTRGAQFPEPLNCPPRIELPDGEQGQDRHLRLRVDYQQSELTRSAVQPPPNKSVQDVPDYVPPSAIPRKPPSPHKKDCFMQKALKYLAKISSGSRGAETTTHSGTVTGVERAVVAGADGGGGTGGAEANRQAPYVMVPLRQPPAPAPLPPPPAPAAPPSPPHAPPS